MKGNRRGYDEAKRLFDVIASAIGLVITIPVQLLIAAVVFKKLGRPVLFRQKRPGRQGEIFELVKFRTMLNVDEARGIVTNQQRMTKFGATMRASSLDELPSLWNVLRGDMSLVGPRPLLVKYLPMYSREQARRHEVRPGLTGLAQVSGRNGLDWETRLSLDVHYVDHRSFVLDMKILLNTVVKVFQREGITSAGDVAGSPFTGPQDAGSRDDA